MDRHNSELSIASGFILGDMTRHANDFVQHALKNKNYEPSIYYFAIIASACYFESILEEFLVIWCNAKANEDKGYLSRLLEAVSKDISKSTGLDPWKKWMKVFYNIDCPQIFGEDWKTIDILFKLRNQLAHGRTTKFTHHWNASNGKFLGLTIKGSPYEIPFEHLLQKGIIQIPIGKFPSATSLLTQSVVEYFWRAGDRATGKLEKIPELKRLRDATKAKTPSKEMDSFDMDIIKKIDD